MFVSAPMPRLLVTFLALVLFHSLGNWTLPLIDRDEPRFAEASREMLERGDFIVPFFNNQFRFDKPPLIYWAQVASYRLLGTNEFAARLPSAIFAAATAIVLMLWCGGWERGWRAALIFSVSLQTIVHARAAVADMAMVFSVALSMWLGWLWLARRSWRLAAGFWAALACGFLAKGPIALLPIAAVGWGAWQQREARPPARQWLTGTLLMFALIAAWGIPALVRTHGEFARIGLGKHVVGRSLSTMEGHGAGGIGGYLLTLPMYFLTVWISFFPWALWLPSAVRDLGRGDEKREPLDAFLIVGVVLVFGTFTLVRTKLPHYTLPAFPLMALVLARWWERTGRSDATLCRTGVAMAGVFGAALLFLTPLARPLFVSESLYRAAAPLLSQNMTLATVDFHEPSLIWTFRKTIDGFQEPIKASKVDEWMAQPGSRLCIIPADRLREIDLQPTWQTVSATGWQLAKGKRLELVALVKRQQ